MLLSAELPEIVGLREANRDAGEAGLDAKSSPICGYRVGGSDRADVRMCGWRGAPGTPRSRSTDASTSDAPRSSTSVPHPGVRRDSLCVGFGWSVSACYLP